MGWLMLSLAIATEVVGTLMLKATDGFTKLWPSIGVAVAYVVSFVLLGQALKSIGVGVAYAIWSGVGTVGIAIAAAVLFGERLTLPIVAGMALVIAGVIVMNLSGSHS
jgi:small multidrug resistance pump